MLLLYNLLCAIFCPLLWLYPPFRGSMRARLGWGLFEVLSKAGYFVYGIGPWVLINAVSAGEVVAISSFIRELKRRMPHSRIVLLTTTDSGQEMARQKLADVLSLCWYFPLADLSFVVRHYLRCLKPSIYITTESELWPNIQAQCKARRIPTALVNARLYLHNKTGARGAIVRALYRQLDLIVCQSEKQRENFRAFGFEGSISPRLAVSGNIKFDFELPEWSEALLSERRSALGLRPQERVLVAGSTHSGEESPLLDALLKLRARPGLGSVRLILASRHVERNGEISALVSAAGLRCCLLSQLEANPAQDWDVLLVDRYGVLVDMYRLADVVVMGGTFNPKVGGHNLLEATALGKPVICGPSTFGITAQLELLREAGAVTEIAGSSELAEASAALLSDLQAAKALGERARQVTLANRGAAERAVDEVLDLLGPWPLTP